MTTGRAIVGVIAVVVIVSAFLLQKTHWHLDRAQYVARPDEGARQIAQADEGREIKGMARKIVGLVVIAWGIFLAARGVRHWREEPLPPNRSIDNYVMSRQIEDVAAGMVAIAMGVLIYRRGLKMFDKSQ